VLVELRHFLRTPKGLLLLVLTILTALAAPGEGIRLVAPGLAVSIGVAALLDAAILRTIRHAWEFPSGAILTGLIVAMVLTPYEPWYVPASTSAIAILSKHLFRMRTANVFNPAALAIVITFYALDAGENWWGALTDLAPPALVVLFASGLFIADRVNKLPLVLAFLGSYFLLFTITAFAGEPRHVAEVFRTPDLQAGVVPSAVEIQRRLG
jgi:Na+-translocating ferredoxin:NAD+ oxidoreductase RnfD subunit